MQAPTVEELLRSDVVMQALEQAWQDSLPQDPRQRHEEGGWIFLNTTTGEILVRRAPSGAKSAIDLAKAPAILDSLVVATFHTHPQSAAEGWLTGPSAGDTRLGMKQGVPCFIRAEDGIHVTGPEARRGGLAGGPGFPP